MSETVADLMRRGGLAVGAATATLVADPRTGVPVVSVGAVVTSENMRQDADADLQRRNRVHRVAG